MALTKTEINLIRLLAALPQQTNQAKLAHYLLVLREQLTLLAGETGQDLPSISAEKAKEYAEQIEALALKINSDIQPDVWDTLKVSDALTSEEQKSTIPTNKTSLDELPHLASTSSGMRRRKPPNIEKADTGNNTATKLEAASKQFIENNQPSMYEGGKSTVKLDSSTQQFVEKHRQLQEDLTDEMVALARQMKEASLQMNRSLTDSEKVLDSTERAMEHSLASTHRANQRTSEIYSQSFKTGCLTWLIIFAMCCMFLFIVFLIRLT